MNRCDWLFKRDLMPEVGSADAPRVACLESDQTTHRLWLPQLPFSLRWSLVRVRRARIGSAFELVCFLF
jgi:hypothetical protein